MTMVLNGKITSQQLVGDKYRISLDFEGYKGYLNIDVESESLKELRLGDKVSVRIEIVHELAAV